MILKDKIHLKNIMSKNTIFNQSCTMILTRYIRSTKRFQKRHCLDDHYFKFLVDMYV